MLIFEKYLGFSRRKFRFTSVLYCVMKPVCHFASGSMYCEISDRFMPSHQKVTVTWLKLEIIIIINNNNTRSHGSEKHYLTCTHKNHNECWRQHTRQILSTFYTSFSSHSYRLFMVAVWHRAHQRYCSTSSWVSTEMGDHSRVYDLSI